VWGISLRGIVRKLSETCQKECALAGHEQRRQFSGEVSAEDDGDGDAAADADAEDADADAGDNAGDAEEDAEDDDEGQARLIAGTSLTLATGGRIRSDQRSNVTRRKRSMKRTAGGA